MKKILHFLDHFEQYMGTLLLFMVFVLFGLSIVLRFVGISASIYQEIIQYGFLIAILLGVSYASRTNNHIRADIITSKVGPKARLVLEIISDLFTIVFSVGLIIASIPMIQTMMKYPQNLPILQIPYWLIYIMLPISCVLSVIRIIQYNIVKFRGTGSATQEEV